MLVSCEKCGKKFNAPDTLAGKRVRCRSCGEVITVPGSPAAAPPRPTGGSKDLSATSASGTPSPVSAPPPARMPGRSVAGVAATATANPTSPTPEIEGGEEQPQSIMEGGRFNTLLEFPGAPIIDQVLPILLLVLSVGWIIGEMLRSNEIGAMWVSLTRIGLFWFFYSVIIWPLTRIGSIAGGKKAEVLPPPQHGLRVYATFAFPTTLAFILWSIMGGVGSLITGLLVGLVIGLAAHLVLYRLKPEEGMKALPIVSAWYTGSIVAAAIGLVALNFGIEQIMMAARTAHEYAESPLGHQLPWTPAPPPSDGKPPTVLPPLVKGPTTVPTVPVVPTDSTATGTTQPTNNVATANPTVEPEPGVVEPEGNAVSKPPTVIVPFPDKPGLPSDQPPAAGNAMVDLPGVGTPGGAAAEPSATEIVKRSSMVSAADFVDGLEDFSDVVFPVMSSRMALLVRDSGETQSEICVWDMNKKAALAPWVPVVRDMQVEPQFTPSADGKFVTWFSTFPSLSMQVWSVEEKSLARTITLNKAYGTPTSVGFSDSTLVWVLWRSQRGEFGLEGFDVKTGQRKKQIALPDYVEGPAGVVFSPDAKYLTMLRQTQRGYELSMYTVSGGTLTRRLQLPGVVYDRAQPITPTGIAYSADGTRVAVMLERDQQGMVMSFAANNPDGKPATQHLFAAGFAGAPKENRGFRRRISENREFNYLGSKRWIINGAGIYDASTAGELADLGLTDVVAQRVVDDNTLELAVRDKNAANDGRGAVRHAQMMTVKLKTE